MELKVVLRNQTPIFSAAPGSAKVDINGRISPEGFPLTRARTMTVIAETGDGAVKPVNLPIVPGNTMRNLLRRCMLKHVIEPTLSERGHLKIGAYAAAYSGNASGNPDGVPNSFDDTVAFRAHPFIGLFGGGPRMLEGRLMVDALYPIHNHAQRILGEGFEDRMVTGKIIDLIWTRRNDPILQMRDADDAKLIEGGAGAVNEWVQGLLAQSASNAEKRKKSKAGEAETASASDEKAARGLQTMNAHEVVVPGVDWVLRVYADNPTPAQVGLLLCAIAQIPSETIAGGHAKGYGRVSIEDVTMNGKSIWKAGAFTEAANDYSDAMAEAMDAMTTEDFERFATSQKEK